MRKFYQRLKKGLIRNVIIYSLFVTHYVSCIYYSYFVVGSDVLLTKFSAEAKEEVRILLVSNPPMTGVISFKVASR